MKAGRKSLSKLRLSDAILVKRESSPDRTTLTDQRGKWLATLTDGAFTVTLAGPRRTFTESTAAENIKHSVWVRTLPTPFDGELDFSWLDDALSANERRVSDVLAIAMEYIRGAPAVVVDGLQISGDAAYGPLKDGKREEGSDFNDYLGIDWPYPNRVDPHEPHQLHCLDCSGFIRMVWGYRHHLDGGTYADTMPLCLEPLPDGAAIPRRAFQIYDAAPGIVITQNTGAQVEDFSHLRIGDLVFFDADEGDGQQIDHVGMYFGLDTGEHHRFISSRKGANGPTLGDYRGKSVLDGAGLYARTFRAVRRL